MYRDIAIAMMGSDGDERALEFGIALAEHFDAKLLPMQVVELPQPTYNAWEIMTDPRIEKVHDKLRHKAQEMADRAHAKISQSQVSSSEVCLVEALYQTAWEAVAKECFAADLIVVGRSGDPAAASRQAQGLASLLMQSGLPILIVPSQAPASSMVPRKIVVAWHSSREARRALNDALPLLHEVESVEMLSYDSDTDSKDPMRRHALIEHLARHGVTAHSTAQGSKGMDIASLIFAHAKKTGADLVVAGAYGHSRFREWAFGGVTREMLLNAPIPVLMSH